MASVKVINYLIAYDTVFNRKTEILALFRRVLHYPSEGP